MFKIVVIEELPSKDMFCSDLIFIFLHGIVSVETIFIIIA